MSSITALRRNIAEIGIAPRSGRRKGTYVNHLNDAIHIKLGAIGTDLRIFICAKEAGRVVH
ncbi:MAG: hypothetical protein OSB34_13090 [Planktomarina sp.]|nr:hypothetical protein [Planktomarina sp.]